MKEEFIQEHNFTEEYLEESRSKVLLDQKEQKVLEFKKRLASDLTYRTDPEEIIQAVVATALEIEGLNTADPAIIVEAVLANPSVRAEMLAMADELCRGNLQ